MPGNMKIVEITDSALKTIYAKQVLEALPEWFGNKEAVLSYAGEVSSLPLWAAMDDVLCAGFLAVKIHYGHTGDIFVCGVRPEYHRNGIGRALYEAAEKYLENKGCKYVIVKTLSDIDSYEPYSRTRAYYRSVGFEPLITLTDMWDTENPCLIMLKTLNRRDQTV